MRVKRADDRLHARMQVLRELFALEDAAPADADAPSDASATGGPGAEVHALPRRGQARAADGRST